MRSLTLHMGGSLYAVLPYICKEAVYGFEPITKAQLLRCTWAHPLRNF